MFSTTAPLKPAVSWGLRVKLRTAVMSTKGPPLNVFAAENGPQLEVAAAPAVNAVQTPGIPPGGSARYGPTSTPLLVMRPVGPVSKATRTWLGSAPGVSVTP